MACRAEAQGPGGVLEEESASKAPTICANDELSSVLMIGPILAEIFGGICQVLPSGPKKYSFFPHNLRLYWTDLHQNCT